MGSFSLWHWIVVLGVMALQGYPLAVICKKAGKPPAIGWIAGTIGLFLMGPLWCVWWLALSSWKASPER